MISKELLSEVLGVEVFSLQYVSSNLNNEPFIQFTTHSGKATGVNGGDWFDSSNGVYFIAHKVKEWIVGDGKKVFIDISVCGDKVYDVDIIDSSTMRSIKLFNSDTEPETIFKAGQYILENK